MKKILFSMIAITLLFSSNAIAGIYNSGSSGADGPFNPTTNTELQLPPEGIFNFTTVNIPAGVTVTFKRNDSNTPVYILATGDVNIVGVVAVNGTSATDISSVKGGPGGFDGGHGGIPGGMGGKGIGPGGGGLGSVSGGTCGGGGGGGFGTSGTTGVGPYSSGGIGGGIYGNQRIIPLIGGSGGGGGAGYYSKAGGSGGGGGGAILIASSGTINITGSIKAHGGNGGGSSTSNCSGGGGGSGGAIRLIANTISGEGTISAIGGSGGIVSSTSGGGGGAGIIRFEANKIIRTSSTNPAYTSGYPSVVFLADIPTLRITSIGGVNVPLNSQGSYDSPDITLPANTTNPVSVSVSASNIPIGTVITITSTPVYGASTSATATLSGTNTSSTAEAQITLSTQYQCILTATATFTIQTAMFYEGERIEKARVASKIGREPEVVYITESGKEIPIEAMMAKLMK